MHALVLTLAVLVSSQLGGQVQDVPGRYGTPPDRAEAAAGTPEASSSATPQADRTTPQPTLANESFAPATAQRGRVDSRAAVEAAREPAAPTASSSRTSGGHAGDQELQAPPVAQTEASEDVETRAGVKPSALAALLFRRPQDSELGGVSLTLLEAVSNAPTRVEQTRRTELYWDLSAATADYYLTLLESNDLRLLAASVANPGRPWQATLQRINARSAAALQGARAAQQRLQLAIGREGATSPPLPADLPHTGDYDARYQELFAGRPDPAAEQLSLSLPLCFENLRSESNRVAEAFQWLQFVSQQRNPQSDGTELLRAYETLALRRRVFVDLVGDYNQAIAAYTALAVPRSVSSERVVAMLIRSTNDRSTSDESVAPAAASEPRSATAESPETRRGFLSNRPRFQARRPIFDRLTNRQREHSILLDGRRRLRD